MNVFAEHPDHVRATWGQLAIWRAMADLDGNDHQFNLGRVIDLPKSITAERVVDVLRMLVGRHESFRTLFSTATDGCLMQSVLSKVDIPINWVEASKENLATETDAVLHQLISRNFRHSEEAPFRIAMVAVTQKPVRLVLVVSHLATDLLGMNVAIDELKELLNGRLLRDAGRAPIQPRTLALEQYSPTGKIRSARSVKHWVSALGKADMMQVDSTLSNPQRPPYWQGLMECGAPFTNAVIRISEGVGVSTTAVFLAAATCIVGEFAGTTRPTIMLMANNRGPRHSRCVTTMALEGIFSVDVGSGSFLDLVRESYRASLVAYRHAQYDKDDLNTALEELIGRPDRLVRACWFNDLRRKDRRISEAGDPAVHKPRLRWGQPTTSQGDEDVAFHVFDRTAGVEISLTADTRLLGPSAIEAYLLKIHDLVMSAARP